ncbi:hypothetical protein RZN25_02725 [Bacillaceae bacterium S4-13-56]
MKRNIILILAVLMVIVPNNSMASIEGYDIVAKSNQENITLYAKERDGLFHDFKIDFKGIVYNRPFWLSVANAPSYAPQIIYEDINRDEKKELIIILTKGYGTGVLWEEVYVFDAGHNRFREVLVDNPIAIVLKNVKTKLTTNKTEITIDGKKTIIDITPLEINPENLFDDIAFGGIISYEIKNNQLIVRVGGQISPAGFVGEVVIVYEYLDKMYQAKSIEFQPADI